MKKDNIYCFHIWFSLGLWGLSFFFPAFYIYEWFEPKYPSSFILYGWLGPSHGFYSWYANVFLLFAVITYNKKAFSLVLSIFAITLALSFLRQKDFEYGQYFINSSITAYGLGFILWILSIGTFLVGQLSRVINLDIKKYILSQSVFSLSLFLLFSSLYFEGRNSRTLYEEQRNQAFEQKCETAEEIIYKKASDATGVFYDPIGYQEITKINDGHGYLGVGGLVGLGSLNSGLIKFYETRNPSNDNGNFAYLRFTFDSKHKGFPTDRLESEYALLQNKFMLPEHYRISGAEVLIKDLRDNTILAKSIYVYDEINNKFCGSSYNGSYNPTTLLRETLNLTSKFRSIYDKK